MKGRGSDYSMIMVKVNGNHIAYRFTEVTDLVLECFQRVTGYERSSIKGVVLGVPLGVEFTIGKISDHKDYYEKLIKEKIKAYGYPDGVQVQLSILEDLEV